MLFDAYANGSNVNPGTSLSWSHTCSGSNRVLFVFLRGGNGEGDKVSSVTYNGVAMTKLAATVTVPSANQVMSGYYLLNPETGAHTVSVSLSSGYLQGASYSYKEALQSGVPDSINTGTASAAGSLTVSTTVVKGGSWLIYAVHNDGNSVSAGTGANANRGNVSDGTYVVFDSDGGVNPGSNSMQATASSGNWGGILISVATAFGGSLFTSQL